MRFCLTSQGAHLYFSPVLQGGELVSVFINHYSRSLLCDITKQCVHVISLTRSGMLYISPVI